MAQVLHLVIETAVCLQLSVYRQNASSINFYKKHGFIALSEQIDEQTGYPEFIMEHYC